MTSKRNYNKLLYALLILLLLVVTVIGGWGSLPAYADTYSNSNVLNDLQKDSAFKVSDYPDNAKDYSINVIQVAEGVTGELYLYTYQPCQKTQYLVATDINMSLSETADGTKLYGLVLVNTSGVFAKYLVKDVKVSSAATRYYNITSVYREWDKTIDGEMGNDNTKKEKYFKVGKLFKAETVDGKIKYSCKNVDTIEIKNPFVDFVSYGQQSGWDYIFGVTNWTDIHYVAFSTDKKIDTLKEADVTYTTQSYHFTGKDGKGYTYGKESEPQYLTLTGKEEIGIDNYKQYTWNSIYRTEDFVKTTNLTGTAKTEVEKSEFVLVFLKTSFEEQEKWSMMQGHYKEADGTKVSDVSILRLEFETEGKVYNLGALMNKQEGDDTAGNKPDPEKSWIEKLIEDIVNFFKNLWDKIKGFNWWQWLLLGLGLILLVGFIVSIITFGIKAIFNLIIYLIGKLLQGLWWLATLPFRLLTGIFKKE